MRAEEGILFPPQSGFDEFTTIDDCLAAKLLLDPTQELSRLVEGHRVSSGALEIESNQRSLIRFGVVEKIHSHRTILRRGESSCAGAEVVCDEFLAHFGWACSHAVQTVIAHIKNLLSWRPPIVQR